jgi:hypothetical protein
VTAALDAEDMRKLGYFVALSLVAHVLIIYGVPFELPRHAAEPPPLEARLQPAEPPPLRPRPTRRPAAAPVVTAPQVAAAPGFDPAPQSTPEPAAMEAPAAAPPAVADSKPDPKPAPPPARRLPRKGEITYALYLGGDQFNVGRTQQAWEIHDDSYRLSSVSETTGLAALFVRQRLAYESRGRLTAGGLRPEHFTTQRVRSGKSEDATAAFDWDAMTAMIDNPQRSVALPAGAQDMVSFMYQLGLTPLAPGRIELPITNGWKLERYELEVGAEEFLQTPFGALRAVPVKQVRRPGQESIELWLAPAYRWLPVRIRFFDRQGEPSGEQLVSEIRVSDD